MFFIFSLFLINIGKTADKDIDEKMEAFYNKVLHRTVYLKSWELEQSKSSRKNYSVPFRPRPKTHLECQAEEVQPQVKQEPKEEAQIPFDSAPQQAAESKPEPKQETDDAEKPAQSVFAALADFYSASTAISDTPAAPTRILFSLFT